jgi:outer membrane beta-barrel protein
MNTNMNANPNLNVTRRSVKDMPMTKLTKVTKSHEGKKKGNHRWLSLLIAMAVTAVPLAAQAQRKSPLADAPAIRKKYELRSTRFELGAGFGSTINQDFYHTLFFDLKASFHLTDWLALGGFANFGVANIATTFQNDVIDHLNSTPAAGQPAFEPTKSDALASMQKINGMYGVQAELTPFAGKYSIGGWLFAHYDFFIFGGLGLISVSPTGGGTTPLDPCTGSGTQGVYSCGVTGTKIGGNFGLGFHSYFNHWMGLSVELRDILAQLNPSGRDTNGDKQADNSDLSWTNTLSFAANLVFYLPATPGISP